MPLRALFPVNNIWCTENKLSVALFDELLSDRSKRPCRSQDLVIGHKVNQRTNGPVNAHLISWPSKSQNIHNLENIW